MGKATHWGDIYNRALARGEDHGYAAFRADQWEARQKRKRQQAVEEQSDKSIELAIADRDVATIMGMSDEQASALEPCPFCAQSVIGPIPGSGDKWDFHCRGCGAVITLQAATEKFVRQNWGTRSTPPE